MQNIKNDLPRSYTMRMDLYGWFLFGTVICFFLWAFINSYIKTKNELSLIFVIICVYSILCLLRIHIRVTETGLTYWCSFILFWPAVHVDFSEVRNIVTFIRESRQGGEWSWMYFTEIFGKTGKKLAALNIKFFSKKDLSLMVHMISKYAPNIELDQQTELMKDKIMPSIMN